MNTIKIILISSIIILVSGCMGVFSPIANSSTSLKKGDNEITLAIGVVGESDEDKDINENWVYPFPYISYQKKTKDDLIYEFYFLGVKRIHEIHKGDKLYFAIYESFYAPIYAVGINAGFLMGYRFNNKMDFFLSAKVDGAFAAAGSKDGGIPFGSYATGSSGINFNNKFFVEFSISKLLYDYIDGNHLYKNSFFGFAYMGFIL